MNPKGMNPFEIGVTRNFGKGTKYNFHIKLLVSGCESVTREASEYALKILAV